MATNFKSLKFFDNAWKSYVYLGGEKSQWSWIHNFCALNLSNALLGAGAPEMKGKNYGQTTPYKRTDAPTRSLLFRVPNVVDYLKGENIGTLINVTVPHKFSKIEKKKGILCFLAKDIGEYGAYGHLTLWNGEKAHPADAYIAQQGVSVPALLASPIFKAVNFYEFTKLS